MTKKKALVKPKPASPEMAAILELLGEDRAYTIIRKSDKVWIIHFEGDTGPTTITLEGEKPEII
jgi:hypothetical protein